MMITFCPPAYPPAYIKWLERLDQFSNPDFINDFIDTLRDIANHHEEPTSVPHGRGDEPDSIFPGSNTGNRQLVRGYLSGIDRLLLLPGKILPRHYNPPISIMLYRRYSGDYPTGFV